MQKRRILTAIFTACICIAFLNYISLKSEIEFLQYWINDISEHLPSIRYYHPTEYPTVLTYLEEFKFQYFLVLSRILAVTILCVGFSIMCLWKMEASRNKIMHTNKRTRILTLIYTACICVAFLNFIALKNELENLPLEIGREVQILPANRDSSDFLANLYNLRLQYFLVLSQFLAVTILCTGFAVMCQWKIEILNKLQPTNLNNIRQKVIANKKTIKEICKLYQLKKHAF